jgi:hypothetical protein
VAERGSRLNGRQERGALFLVDVLDDHLVVGRQGACAAKELFDWQLELLLLTVVRAARRHTGLSVRRLSAAPRALSV